MTDEMSCIDGTKKDSTTYIESCSRSIMDLEYRRRQIPTQIRKKKQRMLDFAKRIFIQTAPGAPPVEIRLVDRYAASNDVREVTFYFADEEKNGTPLTMGEALDLAHYIPIDKTKFFGMGEYLLLYFRLQ